MTETIITAASGIVGTIIGGVLSYLITKNQFKNELLRLREEHKTEFQAEQAVLHYLMHEGYTDRSFETLKKHLGGFEDDELRKILVRAGAIRVYREDKEWWRLLSRNMEYIAKKKNKEKTE